MDTRDQGFKSLFLEEEKKQIEGENRINIKILIGILLVTFIAIGAANMVLRDLNARMNDPFVNLFSIEVPYTKQYVVDQLKEDFVDGEKQQVYGFKSISNYTEFPLSFAYKVEGKGKDLWVKGRSIDLNSPILEALLDEGNLVSGSAYQYDNEPGIIVTQKLYRDLGYDKQTPYLDMTFDGKVIPIPVKAVVKDLPESNSFLALPYFYFQRIENGARPFKEVESSKQLVLFHPDSTRQKECESFLNEFIASRSELATYELRIYPEKNRETHTTGINYTLKLFGYQVESARTFDSLVNELLVSAQGKFDFTRIYQLNYSRVGRYKLSTDRLAVNFSHLDKIREFRNSLFEKYQIEMDLARVLDKENFQLFNLLTQGISYALIGFSLVAICIYLYNMIKSHLEKIKRNLGTFLAFGLDPQALYKLYRELLLVFLSKSIGLAFGLGFLLVTLGSFLSAEGFSLWMLIEVKTFIVILLLYAAFYGIYQLTILRLLKQTPGDLVYERG